MIRNRQRRLGRIDSPVRSVRKLQRREVRELPTQRDGRAAALNSGEFQGVVDRGIGHHLAVEYRAGIDDEHARRRTELHRVAPCAASGSGTARTTRDRTGGRQGAPVQIHARAARAAISATVDAGAARAAGDAATRLVDQRRTCTLQVNVIPRFLVPIELVTFVSETLAGSFHYPKPGDRQSAFYPFRDTVALLCHRELGLPPQSHCLSRVCSPPVAVSWRIELAAARH